jgi:hypothetical protein
VSRRLQGQQGLRRPRSDRDASVSGRRDAAEQLRSSRDLSSPRQRCGFWPLGTGWAMTREVASRVGVTALAGACRRRATPPLSEVHEAKDGPWRTEEGS